MTCTLTYVANAASQTYGEASPSLSGFVSGETPSSAVTGQLAFATNADTGSNVGAYAITGSGLTANHGNYVFVQAAGNAGGLGITPAPLTVTGTRSYDATPGFAAGQLALAGATNGERLTLTGGSGIAASAEAATHAGSGLSGLTLAVSGGNARASNYQLPTTGTLVITPAPITVTANSGTSVYGDSPTDPGLSAAGLQGGQDVGVLTGLSSSFGLDLRANVGRSVLSVAGTLSNRNYVVTARNPGDYTITQRPLTITADAQDRLYGEANPALTYTVGGLVRGDVLSGALATVADAAKGVGRYAITVGSLAASANYAVAYRGADVTITARPVTLEGTRVYDATTAIAGGLLTAGNLVAGDAVSVSGTGLLAAKNVGSQAITGLSGLALSNPNYTLAGATGAVAITRATLPVTNLSALDKIYDGTTAATLAGTPSITPFGADAVTLTGTGVGTFAGRNAGTGISVILSGFGLTGADAGNYRLSLPTPSAAISSAVLTYTATPRSRTYGAVNPPLSGTVSGFVAGESQGSAITGTLAFATRATPSSNVGTYEITGGRLTAIDGNYRFAQAAGNTSALTVHPALLTVTGTKTYDATTGFATGQLGVMGGQNGETVTLARGSGTTISADAGIHAASLADLAVRVSGGGSARAGNYRLPATATVTITPAPVSVTANGGRSTYGDAPANPGLSATGLQGGQEAGVLTGLSNSFDIAATTGAGRHGLTVAGALRNGNYTVTARNDGTWQVDPRPLTLTADAQTRPYGDANSALTSTVGGRGLVNGDGLTGGLTTAAGAASPVAAYAIEQGTLGASADYAVTYVGANLTVGQRPVMLSGTRVYDAGARIVGRLLTAGNVVNGDAVIVSGSGTLVSRDVGLRALSDVSGLALSNANYTLAGAGGAVTITPATLTYAADATRRSYGAANPVLSGTVTGFLGLDTLAAATTGRASFASTAGTGSHAGVYAITGSGLAAGNYVFVQAPGNAGALTVDPAGLTVTGARTYDAATGFHVSQLTVSGGANGETVALTTGAGTTASADAGTYAGASLTGLSLSVSGGNGSAANYRLPATGTFTITPATVTVRANDGRSTYGDAPANPGLSATGLSSSFGLDTASAAGDYGLTVAGRLTNGNYRVGMSESGTYIIDRRPITVTSDALTRIYGDADPALTYEVGGRGLVAGDRLTGALATTAGAESAPGLYRITQGSLTASANYVLSFVGADLAVLPPPFQPEPRPVSLDSSGLASTAERAARLDARPVDPELLLLLDAGTDGALRVSDPRFGATLVCTASQGGCFFTPLPVAPLAAPVPVPTPRASLPASAR